MFGLEGQKLDIETLEMLQTLASKKDVFTGKFGNIRQHILT
jgi:hypothetical protein